MEGYNNDEIAAQLGCARRTVARRLELDPQDMARPRRGGLMAGDPDDQSSFADLEQAQRIHPFCEEFEARCAQGLAHGSKTTSSGPSDGDRKVLLRELLFLEVELKREIGETTSPDDYRTRFPDASSDIDAAFAQEYCVPDLQLRRARTRASGRSLTLRLLPTAFLPPAAS